jgi:lipopolysaccharide transport system permease protein
VQQDVEGHYQLFVFAGNLPWLYFASAAGVGAASVVSNSNLVTKTYFPRILIPLAAVASPLIDFFFSFVVFLGLFAWYREWPSWHIVFLPLFIVLVVNAALGLTLLLAPIVVRWRDINFVLPFVIQLWFYVTPIVYPIEKIPERWRLVVSLNPLTGVIDGFRWCMQSNVPLHPWLLALSVGVSCVVTLAGLITFRRGERRFADVI